ncbi:hypothetical protein OG21DRAFT_1498889 [Imleria badia]|nr:hypothetical protein OG21DRAFT_1498889 [Imleria badia]
MSEVQTLILTGLQLSQWTGLASTTLLLYDHALHLADEVEHFWTGPWTCTRVMYLCIRYLGFMQAVISIMGFFRERRHVQIHHPASADHTLSPTVTAFLFYGIAIVAMALCQIAITIRVWHMFAHSPIIRGIAIIAYITSTLASSVLAGILLPHIREGIPQLGTKPARTSIIAWLYVPSLLFHSLLFALKVYRFVASPKYLQTDTFLWRFLREGMIMYACALASLLFIVIGLTMTDTSQIPTEQLYETAFDGGIIFVTLTIVSMCRAMLSIKSLAATLHVDPGWLLNHAELSRVHWRQGATEGEIVVETFDLPVVSSPFKDAESMMSVDTKGAGCLIVYA